MPGDDIPEERVESDRTDRHSKPLVGEVGVQGGPLEAL